MEGGLKLLGVAMSAAEESKLNGTHIVVKCSLRRHDLIIEKAPCDTGAIGYAFMDENFACQHNLPRYELRTSRALDVIDGQPIASGDVTHMVKVFAKIRKHEEDIPAFTTTLGHYKLILEIPWMRDHNVKLDFNENSLEFTADKCHTTCMKAPTKVYSEFPKHLNDPIRIAMIFTTSYYRMTKKKKNHHTFAMALYDIHQALRDGESDDRVMADTVPPEYHEYFPLSERSMPINYHRTAATTTRSNFRKDSRPPSGPCTHYHDRNLRPYGIGSKKTSTKDSSAHHRRQSGHQSCSSRNRTDY